MKQWWWGEGLELVLHPESAPLEPRGPCFVPPHLSVTGFSPPPGGGLNPMGISEWQLPSSRDKSPVRQLQPQLGGHCSACHIPPPAHTHRSSASPRFWLVTTSGANTRGGLGGETTNPDRAVAFKAISQWFSTGSDSVPGPSGHIWRHF